MNKLKSKFFAGLVACMMALGLFSSISASAAIVTPIPGSVFQFNVTTEKVTYNGDSNSLKLTIRTTNNPGVGAIHFVIAGDSGITFLNEYKGPVIGYVDASMPGYIHGNTAMFNYWNTSFSTNNFEISVYLKMNDPSHSHQIQVYLDSYYCENEFNNEMISGNEENGTVVNVGSPEEVVLGDANGNGAIDAFDGYFALWACQYYGKFSNNKIAVSYLNSQRGTAVYQENLPNLKYAEIIDVDFDNFIDEDDANAIALYYSSIAVGKPDTDSAIGKVFYINV